MLLRGSPACCSAAQRRAAQPLTAAAASGRPRCRAAATAVSAAASLGQQGGNERAQPTQAPDARALAAMRMDADAASSSGRRAAALAEYAELKAQLLKNTAGVGAGLSAYLGLAQHDGVMAASAALGAAGSVAYMALLCRHVDGLGSGGALRGGALKLDKNPGQNLGALLFGAVKRVGDVYWHALAHPQLLVPVALAAGCSAWNAADVGPDAQYVYVLLGFLSYKVAALDQAYKALKAVTLYAPKVSDRPVLKDLPDIDKPY